MYRLGDNIEFWLSNKYGLTDYCYYKITSPCLNNRLNPVICLEKIDERLNKSTRNIIKVPSIELTKNLDNIDYAVLKVIDKIRDNIRKNYFSFINDGDRYDIHLRRSNFILESKIDINGDLVIYPVMISSRKILKYEKEKSEVLVRKLKTNLHPDWFEKTKLFNKLNTLEKGDNYLVKLSNLEITNSNIQKVLRSIELCSYKLWERKQ